MMLHFSRLLTTTLCIAIVGCGDSGRQTSSNVSPSPSASSVTAGEQTPDTATDTNEASATSSNLPDGAPILKVVTAGKTQPLSYTDNDGSVIGLDADVITRIGEIQGFKVQLHKKPWKDLFSNVADGQYDLAISGISYTPEREQKYALSNSYASSPSELMFSDSNLSHKIKDLKSLVGSNLNIGVLEGSKQAKQLSNAGVTNIKTYKTTYLLFTSLLRKETDVIAQDSILLNELAKKQKQPFYTVVYENESEPSAQLVILMAKENEKLRDSINEGLAKIKQNGELAKMQQKWIAAPDK